MFRLRGTRGVTYLPISQGRGGLARDTLLIHLAARRGWKVTAHLRGSELGEVYRRQPVLIRRWLRSALERLDSLAVLGESLLTTLDGIVPRERIAVVPNGTPDPGHGPPRERQSMGLYLSNLFERKGVVQAMEAARIVVREEPSVRFLFVGDCPDESAGSSRSKASPLALRVGSSCVSRRPGKKRRSCSLPHPSCSFLRLSPRGNRGSCSRRWPRACRWSPPIEERSPKQSGTRLRATCWPIPFHRSSPIACCASCVTSL